MKKTQPQSKAVLGTVTKPFSTYEEVKAALGTREVSIHRKAWTAAVLNISDTNRPYKLIAQLETGVKAGLLERLQADDPIWRFRDVSVYRSRPMNKRFFRAGLGMKIVYPPVPK